MSPRVTLGVTTYERDTYLAEAVASCLRQTYDDLEVLVVLDGDTNPNIERVLASFDDPRLRLVRHERNRGIAEAYSSDFRLAQDFDFWVRAVRAFRFRDVPGGPLIGLRRHGDNFSDESAQSLEVQEVQNALRSLIAAAPLRELVPELDWGVMHPDAAERRALEVLADALERRVLPLPGLARELRQRAARVPGAPRPR